MNPLDLYTLDQKSWSFFNIIGQTPSSFSDAAIVTASTSVVTPLVLGGAGVALRLGAASKVWEIESVGGNFQPIAGEDNAHDFGAPSRRIRNVFTPIIDSGTTGSLSLRTNQVTRVTVANTGQIYPATDAAAAQIASGIFAGTGVPNNANGNNGDFYFRSDGGAGTCIYQRRAGAWVATGA